MSVFGHHRHGKRDPWAGAPPWAIELHEQQTRMEKLIMTTQAELKARLDAVLANVADLPTKIEGIEKVLDNLAGEIKKLKDIIANSPTDVDPDIVTAVDSIDAAITTGKQRIVDDINKNTPPETPA